jgi:hypothetical protein
MKVEQRGWSLGQGWSPAPLEPLGNAAQWVLLFGARSVLGQQERLREVRESYPSALILGCSTSGEVLGTEVRDDSLVSTAVAFEASTIQGVEVQIADLSGSREAGERLARALDSEGLVHVFVLSDGLKVNGSELVQGLSGSLPSHVAITGGLSGDGAQFEHTLVCLGNEPAEGRIAAVGLYGERLRIGFGSMGGWDPFGVEWTITRSEGSVLYELDGTSALSLYKEYLGEYAEGLPASGLLFPLSVRMSDSDRPVVRTILAVDESKQSMTFAGDVPVGARARFMKANFERLVDGASDAARIAFEASGSESPALAILISCVGRKLVLQQRVEEEVEAVREVLGENTVLTGFYSYGEISPFNPSARCELHNQTMTITTISER